MTSRTLSLAALVGLGLAVALAPTQAAAAGSCSTFAQILSSVHGLDEPARLKAWITRVAVFTARGWIRRRARKRWLRFFAPEELPEPEVNEPHEEREANRPSGVSLAGPAKRQASRFGPFGRGCVRPAQEFTDYAGTETRWRP